MIDALPLLTGMLGALLGAGTQYLLRRRSEQLAVRREVVETYLLQLQNSLESLYHRLTNVLEQGGKAVMESGYYWRSTAYVVSAVLAQERLLVSEGIYARMSYDNDLKVSLKHGLHSINWDLAVTNHLMHYHRVQLAELALENRRLATYTGYISALDAPDMGSLAERFRSAIEHIPRERLERIRLTCRDLVARLEKATGVPSAFSLDPSRRY